MRDPHTELDPKHHCPLPPWSAQNEDCSHFLQTSHTRRYTLDGHHMKNSWSTSEAALSPCIILPMHTYNMLFLLLPARHQPVPAPNQFHQLPHMWWRWKRYRQRRSPATPISLQTTECNQVINGRHIPCVWLPGTLYTGMPTILQTQLFGVHWMASTQWTMLALSDGGDISPRVACRTRRVDYATAGTIILPYARKEGSGRRFLQHLSSPATLHQRRTHWLSTPQPRKPAVHPP